jgi:hypothetical protein
MKREHIYYYVVCVHMREKVNDALQTWRRILAVPIFVDRSFEPPKSIQFASHFSDIGYGWWRILSTTVQMASYSP